MGQVNMLYQRKTRVHDNECLTIKNILNTIMGQCFSVVFFYQLMHSLSFTVLAVCQKNILV